MRQLLTCLCLTVLVFTACAGPQSVRETHASGTPRVHGTLIEGRQEGLWTYWRAEGGKQSEGTWHHDVQEGAWTWWHADGSVQHQGRYHAGRRDGAWRHYHAGGSLSASGAYVEDRQDGPWLYLDRSGDVQAAGIYLEGVKQGVWLQTVDAFRDVGLYLDGLKTGPWYRFSSTRVVIFNHGLPTGATGASLAHGYAAANSDGLRVDLRLVNGRLEGGSVRRGERSLEVDPRPLSRLPGMRVTIPDLSAARPASSAQIQAKTAPAKTTQLDPGPSLTPIPVQPTTFTRHQLAAAKELVHGFAGGSASTDLYDWSRPSSGDPRGRAYLGKPLPQTRLLATDGTVLDLSERGGRPLVVVLMRGFSGSVCLYCATQTAALADAAGRFRDAGTDVVVVYPGPTESVPSFLDAVSLVRGGGTLALPVALDAGLLLVSSLNLAGDLARPATLILDSQGQVRWAYVGANNADRPTVNQVLEGLAAVKR